MSSLNIASLNSGSNGNCYYIGNDHEAILVDAGISARETDRRMRRLELSLNKVKAIFITHEHSDHIYGVARLAKKYKIPVYITSNTLLHGRLQIREDLVFSFEAYQPVTIGSLTVTPFPKAHDACDPHSFIVSDGVVRVGVFTDIGIACNHVIHHFRQCHAAFLESNYDERMLDTGGYPIHLKNRIRGGQGHLSNRQAFEMFVRYRAPYLSHLLLSHLSENNNRPEIVQNLFNRKAGHTEIVVASRYQESQVYKIVSKGDEDPVTELKPLPARVVYKQLALFQ